MNLFKSLLHEVYAICETLYHCTTHRCEQMQKFCQHCMIIVIIMLITLSGKSSMYHNSNNIFRNIEFYFVGRFWTFEDNDFSVFDVRNSSGISATFFRGICECLGEFF